MAADLTQLTACDDRRDSARVPVKVLVREEARGGPFEEHPGNLGLGGVYFTEGHPPLGTHVELRFALPARGDAQPVVQEVCARGDIVLVSTGQGAYGAHVRFEDLPVETELAIARFLEEVSA